MTARPESKAACCHAHVRRKFEAAIGNDPKRAAHALAVYQQLFDIEDRIAELSVDERLTVRQAESLPILNTFKAWLDEQDADTRMCFPKARLASPSAMPSINGRR